jgi:hypothetical protein
MRGSNQNAHNLTLCMDTQDTSMQDAVFDAMLTYLDARKALASKPHHGGGHASTTSKSFSRPFPCFDEFHQTFMHIGMSDDRTVQAYIQLKGLEHSSQSLGYCPAFDVNFDEVSLCRAGKIAA